MRAIRVFLVLVLVIILGGVEFRDEAAHHTISVVQREGRSQRLSHSQRHRPFDDG